MKKTIMVCHGPGCIANGALDVAASFQEHIASLKLDVNLKMINIKRTGCQGLCARGPVVRIMPEDISYYKVTPEDTEEILRSLGNQLVERLLYEDPGTGKRIKSQKGNSFYTPQMKLALRNVGKIDPWDINDFLTHGGYSALQKALTMSPEEIISEVERSGLRGRGGAGFPAGRKWRAAAEQNSFPKYIIMNGDEGDPGAFMDRSMMEGDPHGILEGIIICALAVGATEGYLYIRDEYVTSVHIMQKALLDAEKAGVLGDSILGSGRSLHLHIVRAGGAFVCGETTALIESIEGGVGEPRAVSIYPTERGLWNQPTVMNNVETLINIPIIIKDGGARYAAIGTETSKGTKVFALTGKVRRSGLIEVPMGITLREIVYGIGGGIIGKHTFKGVQTGGPSGGILPESMLDVPVDFDSLVSRDSMMGSGGMIVMDDWTCMVAVARYNVEFLANECCGACVSCREGLRVLLDVLTRICEGQGVPKDLDIIEKICETMSQTSRCGLGRSAATPVISTLRYFPEEYAEHIGQKRCRAGVCEMGAVR